MLRKFLTWVKTLPASERHVPCLQNSGEARKHLTPPVLAGCVLTELRKLLESCFETESHRMLTLLGRRLHIHAENYPEERKPGNREILSVVKSLVGTFYAPYISLVDICVPDKRVAGGLNNMPALGEPPSCLESFAGTPEPWPGGSRPFYFSLRLLRRARLPVVSNCWLTP